MILRPSPIWPPSGTLPFVSALSVKRCLERLTDGTLDFSIKWPNDVLCNRKKISGILHESQGDDQLGQSIVVGIGINVEHYPTSDVLYPTTSLRNEGYQISRDQVIIELTGIYIELLSRWLSSGYSAIKDELAAAMVGIGEQIIVRQGIDPTQHRSGLFKGLDETGRLILETASGDEDRIAVGDVFLT